MSYREIATDRWGTDLSLPIPDEEVTPTLTGDWPVVTGRDNLHAAHRRRAVTTPGELIHRPLYGGGMSLELEVMNSPANMSRLGARVKANALRDSRIEEAVVEISSPLPFTTLLKLTIRPRGEPVTETIAIQNR